MWLTRLADDMIKRVGSQDSVGWMWNKKKKMEDEKLGRPCYVSK